MVTGITAYKWRSSNDIAQSTLVWMFTRKLFSLCCYTNEKEQAEYPQKVDGHYSKVINYIEAMRFHYGDDALFICGYEICASDSLYHQLTDHNVKCIILAPTTMLQQGQEEGQD